jgi:hypothetical protein
MADLIATHLIAECIADLIACATSCYRSDRRPRRCNATWVPTYAGLIASPRALTHPVRTAGPKPLAEQCAGGRAGRPPARGTTTDFARSSSRYLRFPSLFLYFSYLVSLFFLFSFRFLFIVLFPCSYLFFLFLFSSLYAFYSYFIFFLFAFYLLFFFFF